MIIKILCILTLEIKNVFGEFIYEGDVNAQYNQIWPNGVFNNNQENNAALADLTNPWAYSTAVGTDFPFPNSLLDTLLPAIDVNNLLVLGLQNINNQPDNVGFNFVNDGNVLIPKNNLAFTTGVPNQIENSAKAFYNNPMLNSVLNNNIASHISGNNVPIIDNLPNNLRVIKPAPNNGYQMNNELNYKQPVRNDLFHNYLQNAKPQDNLLTVQNGIQNRNMIPNSNVLHPLLTPNRVPLNDQIDNFLPVFKPGNLNQDVMISHPSVTFNPNNQYSNKIPAPTFGTVPFNLNTAKDNNLHFNNGIPNHSRQYASIIPGMTAMNNNLLPNTMLRNPALINGFNEEQVYPRPKTPFHVDSNVLNMFPIHNKATSDNGMSINNDIPNIPNVLLGNVQSNGISIPNLMVYSSGTNIPLDKQIDFNSFLLNNLDNIKTGFSETEIPIKTLDYAKCDSTPVALSSSESNFAKFYTPTGMANANVLNLGEFGSLPIINGLPVASIIETVTVLNPNTNCY